MTYGIVNPSPEQQRAWTQQPWGRIIQQVDHFRELFLGQDVRAKRLMRITFSDQAVAMLESMNRFDLVKVLDEIIDLTYNPSPNGHRRHWRNPWVRFIKSRYPFPHYHYMIEYAVRPDGGIAVREIYFDKLLYGPQEPHSHERNMLYNVERLNGMRYDRPMTRDETRQLRGAWRLGKPVPQITTAMRQSTAC
jgi:hypothetical protein